MATPRKSPLGRGLDALISTDNVSRATRALIDEIPLDRIYANPNQPRREFDKVALQELADSIKEFGIIQPVTLRSTEDGRYEIIAGERRFRAAGMAGLKSIPAYVRTATDESTMQMALIENIQREDLNAIEVSLACKDLLERYDMTQEQLSRKIGKNRATIANYIRLLGLPAEIQIAIRDKKIEMGHARALLSVTDPVSQLSLFHESLAKGYSVREVEQKVKKLNAGKVKESIVSKKEGPDTTLLSEKLSHHFGCAVNIKCSSRYKGHIDICFENRQEMQKILEILDRQGK